MSSICFIKLLFNRHQYIKKTFKPVNKEGILYCYMAELASYASFRCCNLWGNL